MEGNIPFLVFALVCLEATGLPDRSKNMEFLSYESNYTCADCHTAKISRRNRSGKIETIEEVHCIKNRPYCNPNTGSCTAHQPPGCSAAPTNAMSTEVDIETGCKYIFSCLDCNTAQVCRPTAGGDLVFLKNLPCSEDRPYCDSISGTCVAKVPVQCGINGEFTCIEDGKFPDLDCNSYHTCVDSVSTTLKCPSHTHYNPKTGVCDETVPCKSFSCGGNAGLKVPHPLDPQYFVFCGSNGPIAIDSCHGPYELNFTSQLCEATCHNNGLIQDLEDCHFYYKCTEVFLTINTSYFQKERKRCPEGQAFDPSEYLCVSGTSKIPGCTG